MREALVMKSIGVLTWRRAASRCGVRAALRIAFVGVVLASGAQDPRPFAGEPSGGLGCLAASGAVRRGSGADKDRRGASAADGGDDGDGGRGERAACRGSVRDRAERKWAKLCACKGYSGSLFPPSTLIHEHKVCKGSDPC